MSYTTFDDCVKMIKKEILYGHDGPVTQFVIINRAIELAKTNRYSSDTGANCPISNALSDILKNVCLDPDPCDDKHEYAMNKTTKVLYKILSNNNQEIELQQVGRYKFEVSKRAFNTNFEIIPNYEVR